MKPDGIQTDVDLALAAAQNADLSDPGDRLQLAAQDLVGVFREFADGTIGHEGEVQDRGGVGIELLDDRGIGGLGQVGEDLVDAVADLLGGDVDVLLEEERHEHLGDTIAGGRADLVDAADRVDGLLDLVGDLGLDLTGGGAVEPGGDGDGGEIDLGESVDLELGVPVDADDQEDQDRHAGEHGAADGQFSEPLHVGGGSGLRDLCREAVGEARFGGVDHRRAVGQAASDLDPTLDGVADFDEAFDECVALDEEHAAAIAFGTEGRGRNGRGLLVAGADAGLGKESGAESLVGVGHLGFDLKVTGGFADGGADEADLAGEGLAGEGGGLEVDGLSRLDPTGERFGNVQDEAEAGEFHKTDDAGIGADVFAGLNEPFRNHAGEGGAGGAVVEVLAGLVASGAGPGEFGFADGEIGLEATEVCFGNGARLDERGVPFHVAAGEGESGLGEGQGRLGFLE